jgi:opacity protein-like surface antigen
VNAKELIHMKKIALSIAIILTFCFAGWAQDAKHEVTIQGSGVFTKETTNNGITSKPTDSGGFLAGYRYNINRWLAAEGDFDYFRASQKYQNSTGTFGYVKTNTYAVTGSAVVKIPTSFRVKPYALVGGGVLVFDPRDSALSSQAKGTFVYGGGADYKLMKHIALRAQYRGFVYKVPDFDGTTLHVDKVTHSAVPSAGLVFTF